MPARLLPGERLETRLSPHPFAWMGRYFIAAYPAILGLLLAITFTTEWWQGAGGGKWYQVWTWLYGNTPAAYVYMLGGLAIMGAIIAVAAIRWRTFFLYVAIGITILAVTLALGMPAEPAIPLSLVFASLPLLIAAELDRRSHEYTLTNLRIIFSGGVLVRKERSMKYEAVTDLDSTQSILGRLFNYGTLIPVTQSGFGLGADSSNAGIAVGGGAEKGGMFGGGAVMAGGGKEVSTGRAKSFHQLTGVRPYEEIQYRLEALIQEATSTPYLREQVELQREMVGALREMRGEPPVQ